MSGDVQEMSVEEWNALWDRVEVRPSTPDDVWVTADGRRLDTPDKLIAFLREYNAQREREALTRGASRRTAP